MIMGIYKDLINNIDLSNILVGADIGLIIIFILAMLFYGYMNTTKKQGHCNPMGVPSVKCPTCAAEGVETWVIYGKVCPRCGTACD